MVETKKIIKITYPYYCFFYWSNLTKKGSGIHGVVMNFPKPIRTSTDMLGVKITLQSYMTQLEAQLSGGVICQFEVSISWMKELDPEEVEHEEFVEQNEESNVMNFNTKGEENGSDRKGH